MIKKKFVLAAVKLEVVTTTAVVVELLSITVVQANVEVVSVILVYTYWLQY